MAISGRTRVFTILAHPSVNVTAPLIYNHIFSRMGLDMVYISHDVHPGAIADTVRSFSGWVNLGGFNVTIPHKESVAALVDDLCGVSMKTGTVNTVVRHGNGSLSGYNTDGIGALGALGETRDAVCLVIGAGGAARAIVHALLEGGARKVSILNRSPYRTQQLCGMFGTGPVHEYQGEPLEEVDVVVQATPFQRGSLSISSWSDSERIRASWRPSCGPRRFRKKPKASGCRSFQGTPCSITRPKETSSFSPASPFPPEIWTRPSHQSGTTGHEGVSGMHPPQGAAQGRR